jgi:Glycosyltransferases involved in cell wall biogenesis
MMLSVVSTLYQSQRYIEDFHRRICAEAKKITNDFEVIFVNDGSTDNSLQKAVALTKDDSRVRVIDLSRNFGHHKAMMTGLEHATGDLVFLIDVDLEEPPEVLGSFYETLTRENADVAYGIQAPRHGPWLTRTLANLFYAFFEFLSDYSIPQHSLTARLMTRRYVNELVRFKEHLSNMIGLWELAGFKQVPVPVRKDPFKGTTTYTFRRKMAAAIYAITAFSSKPLRYIAYLGFVMTLLCALYVVELIFEYFILGRAPTGWTSLIVSVWLLSGIILFCLGIISTYLAVIFVETKDRPYTVIRHIYESREQADTASSARPTVFRNSDGD